MMYLFIMHVYIVVNEHSELKFTLTEVIWMLIF